MLNRDLYCLVVTCAVLSRNSENVPVTLILKRGEDEQEGPGLWTIPGGKVERSDCGNSKIFGKHSVWTSVLKRAMQRELLEETGITVQSKELFVLPNIDVIFLRIDGTPTLVIRFWTYFGHMPLVIRGNEATAHTWVRRDELIRFDFIGNVRSDVDDAFEEALRIAV